MDNTATALPAFLHFIEMTTARVVSSLPSWRAPALAAKLRIPPCSSRARSSLLPPRSPRQSRRVVSLSLVFLNFFAQSKETMSVSILDKYVKKKKLDPLESYIPGVILTELQIAELGKYLEVDQPKFADCRSLLRSGPASSLRANIRAVAQYASEAGDGKSAFHDVDQCLSTLEELDSLLLRASRNDSGTSVEAMKAKVVIALNALDSLLKTVPSEVLDKGKDMAEEYLMTPEDNSSTENLEPELKQLESIL